MFKKTLVLFAVVLLLVGIMVFPASAASYAIYDWMDLAEIYWTDNDTTPPQYALHGDLPKQNWFLYVWENGVVKDKAVYENGSVKLDTYFTPNNYYRISFGFYNLWTHDIPPAWPTEIWYSLHFWGMNWNTDISTQPSIYWSAAYSDDQYYEGNDGFTDHYDFDPSTGDFRGRANPTLNNFGDWVIPAVIVRNFYVNKSVSCTIELTNLELDLRCTQKFYNSWKEADLEKTQEKNQLLLQNQELLLNDMIGEQQTTNDKLDELPGEIGDEMQGVIETEKQEASNTGDSAAGELMDIIPNESQGFMNAIQSLVSSMSYNGTEAKLSVPPITLPEISGVMSSVKLTDEQEVDFGFWIQKLPSSILQLVRILCTIALIVYCFKELYSTISYALTLKGGKSDE